MQRDADLADQAAVAQLLQAGPHGGPLRAEQISGQRGEADLSTEPTRFEQAKRGPQSEPLPRGCRGKVCCKRRAT